MATLVHPAFHTHNRGYGLIGTRSTPTKSPASHHHHTGSGAADESEPATSSSTKSRMEVYIDIPISPSLVPRKLKKALDKNQKTTLDKYFARPVDVPRVSLLKKPLTLHALNDKHINFAQHKRGGIIIDLTQSPPRKRKAAAGESSEEDKKAKKARTEGGEKRNGRVDENGLAKNKVGASLCSACTHILTWVQMANGMDDPQAPVKRTRKVVEPLWVPLPAPLDRPEVEARIHLREFVVRFRPILRLAKSHIDALDEFASLTKETVKAVAVALLDLIAVDAEAKAKGALKLAIRDVTAASGDPGRMWTALQRLLEGTFSRSLEIPQSAEEGRTRRSAGRVSRPEQLMDALLALVDITVQGESVKLELAEGEKEMKEKAKEWTKGVKQEEERWQEERARLVFERPGKTGRGASREELERERAYKAKYAAANKAHKLTLATLNSSYFLSNSASISRFAPLGRDVDGRVYYVLSPFAEGRVYARAVREAGTRWSWFVVVWGKRPESAPDPGEKAASEGSSEDVERALARLSTSSSLSTITDDSDQDQEQWHAFSTPVEIRRLAKWADHVAAACVSGERPPPEPRADGLPPTTGREISALCEGLNGFADYLEWRCREEDEREEGR
ncbi:hypothetical protein CALVIDRAFT_537904 [Calocera viscosa TUFC12733]|uniref:Uncharacterized protein n=1 Tax=Calocera viscosa (strain TUFC12733) TaxID=1330018 RepID=A0A167LBQ9_CALVF|nr:hypothetical protein CALVIDRAFT_537904 [Calocera viscosa TUFC12733]